MPTTPKSVSVNVLGTTNTTIYTVPALKTAIVKAVIGANADNGGSTFTVSKAISGQNYPISTNQSPVTVNATGGTTIRGVNLLQAPITMAAGEELKAYASAVSYYNLPSVSSATPTTAADGSTYSILANLFANGIYMAVGNCTSGAYVATSTDAITWTQRTGALAVASQFNLITCNGSVWVATNTANSQGTVYYSSDNGVTWAPAVVVASATNFQCLINNGSTFLISGSNYKIYSSTNGSTWTDITSYTTAIGSSTAVIYNLGWTGSHWIVDNQYGALATTDLTTWFGYVGNSLGRISVASIYTTTYSTYYSKYYSTKRVSGQPNIFSSSNGYLWENLASSSATPYKICCAGTNTILIGVESGTGTTRLKSTDGSTFTSTTAAGSYNGPVFGLENGYFLSMQNNGTNDASSLSTDPTTTTGTTYAGGLGSFNLSHAAADPISGKWVGVGKTASDIYSIGGTSGTNIGVAYNPSRSVATYGIPTSVTWSAVDSCFYMVTDAGFVFKMTAYNAGWSLQTTTAKEFLGSTTSIKAVGSILYIVSNSGGAYPNTVFSSATAGASWNGYTYSSVGTSYRGTGDVQNTGMYYGESLATDNTNLVWNNRLGRAFALTPSNGTYAMRMPSHTVGTVQIVNSIQFMYGGYTEGVGATTAYFTSTNVITTYGTAVNINNLGTGYYWAEVQNPPNKMAYSGGVYYITSTLANSLIWNGTTPTTLGVNAAQIGTTIAGVSVVNPSNGWMLDGTNLVGSANSGRLNAVCKTSTPANFLYAATMTASVVEID
jgi:hypothetical protein